MTYTDENLYGKPRQPTSPGGTTQYHITETRTRTLSPTPVDKYIISNNNTEVATIPKNNLHEVVRVENTTGPEALHDIQLSNDILPRPKTKVTTTIRTYTYEIPEDGIAIPKNNAMFYKTERNERNVNYYPNNTSTSPLTIQEVPVRSASPIPPQENIIRNYKYESHTTSRPPSQPPQHGNVPPGGITIYPTPQPTATIYKTTETTTNKYRSPTPTNQYLPGVDPNSNHPHSPGWTQYPQQPGYPQYPQQQPHVTHPNEPSVVVYKQTTTTRTVPVPRPGEREPLHPFPVDGPIITEVDGNPPKRVEDLMASFGDTSEIHYTKKNVQIAEKPYAQHNPHNVSTLSTTQKNVYSSEPEDRNKSAVVPSKNVAGPPVYYPPNHELFTRKEESAAAGYRAQVRFISLSFNHGIKD